MLKPFCAQKPPKTSQNLYWKNHMFGFVSGEFPELRFGKVRPIFRAISPQNHKGYSFLSFLQSLKVLALFSLKPPLLEKKGQARICKNIHQTLCQILKKSQMILVKRKRLGEVRQRTDAALIDAHVLSGLALLAP